MKSEENSKPSLLAIVIMTLFSISTLMMVLFIFEFSSNYKIIKEQNQFKKIKVKIDSSEAIRSSSGKSSSSSYTTYYYFDKGSSLKIQDTKGALFSYNSPNYEIQKYMSNHMDSINLWYLNKKNIKYAPENEIKINTSEESGNNLRVSFYFLIYVIFTTLVFKFKNQIFKKEESKE